MPVMPSFIPLLAMPRRDTTISPQAGGPGLTLAPAASPRSSRSRGLGKLGFASLRDLGMELGELGVNTQQKQRRRPLPHK